MINQQQKPQTPNPKSRKKNFSEIGVVRWKPPERLAFPARSLWGAAAFFLRPREVSGSRRVFGFRPSQRRALRRGRDRGDPAARTCVLRWNEGGAPAAAGTVSISARTEPTQPRARGPAPRVADPGLQARFSLQPFPATPRGAASARRGMSSSPPGMERPRQPRGRGGAGVPPTPPAAGMA